MTAPEDMGPERLGEIVDGAAPRNDAERAMMALLEEARGLEPAAPDALRRKVLDAAGREPSATSPTSPRMRALDPRRWLGGGAEGRRRLLVAAPVTAAVLALLVAIPVLDGGGSDATSPLPQESSSATPAEDSGAARMAGPEAAPPSGAPGAPAIDEPAPGVVTDPGRLQRVSARTRVQVEDVRALSRASTSAMRTVRGLGGFTARSDYGVPDGGRGTNELTFRLPVARVDRALTAFGDLSVVLSQSAAIVDVTDRVASADRGVARLRARLAELRARAAADPADAALVVRVARAEAELERARAAVAAQRRQAALATITLTLTTEGPPPPPVEEGRFAGPISGSLDRLAATLAWLLAALVLVVPLAVPAGLAAWGAHRLRGRSDRRLMGSAS